MFHPSALTNATVCHSRRDCMFSHDDPIIPGFRRADLRLDICFFLTCDWFLKQPRFPADDQKLKLTAKESRSVECLLAHASVCQSQNVFAGNCKDELDGLLNNLGSYPRELSISSQIGTIEAFFLDDSISYAAKLIVLYCPPLSRISIRKPESRQDLQEFRRVWKSQVDLFKGPLKKKLVLFNELYKYVLIMRGGKYARDPTVLRDDVNESLRLRSVDPYDCTPRSFSSVAALDTWVLRMFNEQRCNRLMPDSRSPPNITFSELVDTAQSLGRLSVVVSELREQHGHLLGSLVPEPSNDDPFERLAPHKPKSLNQWKDLYENIEWNSDTLDEDETLRKLYYGLSDLLKSHNSRVLRAYIDDLPSRSSPSSTGLRRWFGKSIGWIQSIMNERKKTLSVAQRKIIAETLQNEFGGRRCIDIESSFSHLKTSLEDSGSRISRLFPLAHFTYGLTDSFRAHAVIMCAVYSGLHNEADSRRNYPSGSPSAARKRHCLWSILTEHFTDVGFDDPFCTPGGNPIHFFRRNGMVIMVRRGCNSSIYFFAEETLTSYKMKELALFAQVGMIQLVTAKSSGSTSGVVQRDDLLPNTAKYDQLQRLSLPILGEDWIDFIRETDLPSRFKCLATKVQSRGGNVDRWLRGILQCAGVALHDSANWVEAVLTRITETSPELGFNGMSQVAWVDHIRATNDTLKESFNKLLLPVSKEAVDRTYATASPEGLYTCCVCYTDTNSDKSIVTCKNAHICCTECLRQWNDRCPGSKSSCPMCRDEIPKVNLHSLSCYLDKFGLRDARKPGSPTKRKHDSDPSDNQEDPSKKAKLTSDNYPEVIVIDE